MSKLCGSYSHVKNENLEAYYQAVGIPFVARKMMSFTSPSLNISKEGDEWTITTTTTLRTVTVKFKLNEEYDEAMPKGTLKSTTSSPDESNLTTVSIGPNDTKIIRTYTSTDEGCTLTMSHEASGKEAKRYFKRN